MFLTSDASVVNMAKSGAGSKSFIDLGLLDRILAVIKRGDYLLISFGHNDEKIDDPSRYTEPSTTYKQYLSQYIDKSRAKGATPVLVTSVERRHFDGAGRISPSHGAYPAAMRELAAAKGIMIAPTRLPRVRSAAARASVTRSVRMWSAIAQPARRREARSMTVAKYRNFHAYLRWRNANARHPNVLAAQRREHARVRSEKGIRWGGCPLATAA